MIKWSQVATFFSHFQLKRVATEEILMLYLQSIKPDILLKNKWNPMERGCRVNINEKIYSMESIVIVSSVFCHHSQMSQVLLPPFYRLGNWGHRPSREWNPSEHPYPYLLTPRWDRTEVGTVWGNPGNTRSWCRPSHHYFSFLSTFSVIQGTECLIDGATDQHTAKLPSR